MTTYTVDNANLNFSPGNWVFSGSTYAQTNNPGAYIRGAFTGTAITVSVDGSMLSSTPRGYVGYRVDSGSWTLTQLSGANPQVFTVGTGLANTSHTFEFMFAGARGNTNRWSTTVENVVRVTAIDITGTIATPTVKSKKWLIFGDSITEGTNVLSDSYGPAAADGTDTWGLQVGEANDAEVGICAFISQGWTTTGNGNVPIFHNPSVLSSWAYHYQDVARSFTGIDAILVAMGANDAVAPATVATVITNATDFLTTFHAANPTVHIYMVELFGGFSTYRNAIRQAMRAAALPNCSIVTTSDSTLESELDGDETFAGTYTNDGLHPNQAGHDRIAELLTERFDLQMSPFMRRTMGGWF